MAVTETCFSGQFNYFSVDLDIRLESVLQEDPVNYPLLVSWQK